MPSASEISSGTSSSVRPPRRVRLPTRRRRGRRPAARARRPRRAPARRRHVTEPDQPVHRTHPPRERPTRCVPRSRTRWGGPPARRRPQGTSASRSSSSRRNVASPGNPSSVRWMSSRASQSGWAASSAGQSGTTRGHRPPIGGPRRGDATLVRHIARRPPHDRGRASGPELANGVAASRRNVSAEPPRWRRGRRRPRRAPGHVPHLFEAPVDGLAVLATISARHPASASDRREPAPQLGADGQRIAEREDGARSAASWSHRRAADPSARGSSPPQPAVDSSAASSTVAPPAAKRDTHGVWQTHAAATARAAVPRRRRALVLGRCGCVRFRSQTAAAAVDRWAWTAC